MTPSSDPESGIPILSQHDPKVAQRLRRATESRIVVVEQVSHGRTAGQETQLSPSYQRFLKSNEQAYGPREQVATPSWLRLDHGWIQKCSLLIVQNTSPSRNISEEEFEQGMLEITDSIDPDSNTWLVAPGESFRGCPSKLDSLRVRCRVGRVPYLVTVFPE